jgi:hypothetical protein
MISSKAAVSDSCAAVTDGLINPTDPIDNTKPIVLAKSVFLNDFLFAALLPASSRIVSPSTLVYRKRLPFDLAPWLLKKTGDNEQLFRGSHHPQTV